MSESNNKQFICLTGSLSGLCRCRSRLYPSTPMYVTREGHAIGQDLPDPAVLISHNRFVFQPTVYSRGHVNLREVLGLTETACPPPPAIFGRHNTHQVLNIHKFNSPTLRPCLKFHSGHRGTRIYRAINTLIDMQLNDAIDNWIRALHQLLHQF